MIVDNVWKLTNTVRVGLDARSSHAQRQSTFPDNVCSYCHTGEGAAIRTSVNIFEVSKRDKPQYCVDKVKDKRRNKNNNLEFLIGWLS
jgi:hypothetical protein